MNSYPIAQEAEFECGYEHREDADEFSGYEHGLVAHEAGHVLYRYGEYGTALKCMEFASQRGIVWADDDVTVVQDTMARAETTGDARLGEFRPPITSGVARPLKRRLRRWAGAVAAAVVILLGWQVIRLQAPVITATQPPPAGFERFDSLVLRPEPAAPAQQVPVNEGRVATSAPAAVPSRSGASGAIVKDPLDGTAMELRWQNSEGGMSTAFVPRERGPQANESRMRWNGVASSRLVATLQSSNDAECTWVFLGNDGPKPEYRSSAVAVEPGTVKRVEVPTGRWRDLTATARTDASAGGCLMVDPKFVPEGRNARGAPAPRPVSAGKDPWPASRPDPVTAVPSESPAVTEPVTPSATPAAEPATPAATPADAEHPKEEASPQPSEQPDRTSER